MPPTATIEMPAYCFDVILGRLNNLHIPLPTSIPNDKHPLFVTWKKSNGKHLRGCIGTFSRDIGLHECLTEYAVNSAFRDSRFEPITAHEVPQLQCSVSILLYFEPARDYRDWVIGVHGIRIDFQQGGRAYSAVYLPEVAREQGWAHQETLDHLLRKGGFQGPINETDRMGVIVERFQSEKVSIEYEEYVVWKKRRGEDVHHHRSNHHRNGKNGIFNSCRP